MDTLTINGKEYKFNITWGRFEKSLKKREKQKDGTENAKYLFEDIWLFLERGFLFKPFIFKWRLKDRMSLMEVRNADLRIRKVMEEFSEDREGKNSVE